LPKECCNEPQFKIFIENGIQINTKSLSDSYIGCTEKGSLKVFKVVNVCIKKNDKSKVIVAKQFNNIKPFYKKPINSLKLGYRYC